MLAGPRSGFAPARGRPVLALMAGSGGVLAVILTAFLPDGATAFGLWASMGMLAPIAAVLLASRNPAASRRLAGACIGLAALALLHAAR